MLITFCLANIEEMELLAWCFQLSPIVFGSVRSSRRDNECLYFCLSLHCSVCLSSSFRLIITLFLKYILNRANSVITSDVLPAHSLMSSLVSRLICLVMIVRNLLSLYQLSALTNKKTVDDNVSQSEALSCVAHQDTQAATSN